MSDIKMDIDLLLEKYMDGDTSCREEETLRKYFCNEDNIIPEEWQVYRAMFRYCKEEACGCAAGEDVQQTGQRHKTLTARAAQPFLRKPFLYIASAAASVAIIIAVYLAVPHGEKSYAMIDGRKYTDKAIVMSEAEEALMTVMATEDETFEALTQIQ